MMGGVVFPLLWGLVGRPGLPWALSGWAWAPRLGRFGVTGGAYGGKRGSWLQRGGGYFAPSDAFLPIPKASLLPLQSHQTYGRVLRCGCVAGMRGEWYSSVSSWPPDLNYTLQLRTFSLLTVTDTIHIGPWGWGTLNGIGGRSVHSAFLWCPCPLLNFKLHIDIEGSGEGTSWHKLVEGAPPLF